MYTYTYAHIHIYTSIYTYGCVYIQIYLSIQIFYTSRCPTRLILRVTRAAPRKSRVEAAAPRAAFSSLALVVAWLAASTCKTKQE